MENLEFKNHTYRIKKLNAIQILAFRTQVSFDDFKASEKLYMLILENIEVQCNDKWLPVKQGNNYYPKNIEDDIETIERLLDYFLEYLKEVFPKSNESKAQQ